MQNLESNNTKLTVGFTTPGWPMSYFPNGIVTYVHNIIAGFDASIKPVVLAAPLIGDEIKDKFVDLYQLTPSKSMPQRLVDKVLSKVNNTYTQRIQYQISMGVNARKIARATQLLQNPLDILEIEESFGTASALISMVKVPIVSRIHGPWFTMASIMKVEQDWDYKLKVFYEGEAIKHANGVTAPSLDVLNKVREYYGFDLPHARVIPNPVLEVSVDKRWQYDAKSTPIILFIGRFDSHKGGDIVLEAFRLIATKNKDITLIFVGPDRGVIVDGIVLKSEAYMQHFIPEAHIKNRIQFLGHCDHSRISSLRKSALVTVVCSRYETFSIALAESLSAGCPTIATAVGGMKEIIIDDYNGLLAEPESPESIAEKVLLLVHDPEKMQRLSKNAIEDCKKRFSPEVVAAQTVDYYQSVLARVSNTAS